MDPKAIINEEAKRWGLEARAFFEERQKTKPNLPEWDIYAHGPSNSEEVQAAIEAESEKEHIFHVRFEDWKAETETKAAFLRQRLDKHKSWNIKSLQAWFERELGDLIDPDPTFSWERNFSEKAIARRNEAEERARRKRLTSADDRK